MAESYLKSILKSDQTVFTFKELLLKFRTSNTDALKSKLNYYVKKGDLHKIRRGIYSKSLDYDSFELATKIYTPSYVSFETVLTRVGVIFQYYNQIFVASYQSRRIICDNKQYTYRKIKYEILINSEGIESHTNYNIATPERAFLDLIYLEPNYHFDNLEPIDWNKVYKILPIYKNINMEKRVKMYHKAKL